MQDKITALAALVPTAADRRDSKRVNKCFKIQFQVLTAEDSLNAYRSIEERNADRPDFAVETGHASMENFSFGGLGIMGDLDLLRETGLEKNSFLAMELEVPGVGHKLHCVGTVAWVIPYEPGDSFRAGVSFISIDEEDLALVGGAIQRSLRDDD